jgi:hypothetical protein
VQVDGEREIKAALDRRVNARCEFHLCHLGLVIRPGRRDLVAVEFCCERKDEVVESSTRGLFR